MDLNLPEKRVFIGPAQFWKRLLAFIVDILILDFFVFSMYKGLVAQLLGQDKSFFAVYSALKNSPGLADAFMGIFTLIVVFALAYFVLMEYLIGQTPGKMLMDIHVVSGIEDDITRPTFAQCILRSIFLIPAIPFILLWIIDPAYLIFTKKGQRFTEWLSKTRVVEQFSF